MEDQIFTKNRISQESAYYRGLTVVNVGLTIHQRINSSVSDSEREIRSLSPVEHLPPQDFQI